MKKYFFLAVLILFRVPFAQAALHIEYTSHGLFTPAQVQANVPPPGPQLKEGDIAADLGVFRFAALRTGEKQIYDFKSRQIFLVSDAAKQYRKFSLYSVPGFRINEFQNRIAMNDMLKQSGAKEEAYDRFSLESIFGIKQKETSSDVKKIEITESSNTLHFSYGSECYAQIEFSERPLAGTDLDMFIKYLIYTTSLHPDAAASIRSKERIPARIAYHIRQPEGSMEMEYVFKSVEVIPSEPEVPKEYTDAGPENTDLSAILSGLPGDVKKDKDLYKKNSAKAFDQGKFLSSVLIAVEYAIITGDQELASQAMERVKPFQTKGTDLEKFFKGLDLSSEASAKSAVLSLESIQRKKNDQSYLIDLMLSNAKAAAGDIDEGIKLIESLLRDHPDLIGAYKDLGGMFFQHYQMAEAWLCWDSVRAKYPEHPLFKPISEMEAALEKDLPDYF